MKYTDGTTSEVYRGGGGLGRDPVFNPEFAKVGFVEIRELPFWGATRLKLP